VRRALLEGLPPICQIRFVPSSLLIGVFVALFGLVIGSFLNVCILRIPERKSIVLPASACPKCGAAIRPYDNIPVLSWLVLGGKCRNCKNPISPMYPLVEALTGLLFFACYFAFGFTLDTLKWCTFSALMIVLVFTDLRERMLPDVVNFTGFAIGLVFSFFTVALDGTARWLASHMFDFPPPAPVLSFRLRGREGMGLGDVKMMLLVGAFLGVKRTLLTILAGSLLGSILGILFIAARRKDSESYELPFGTFLGMAAMLVVFFGTPVVNWYQSLLVR